MANISGNTAEQRDLDAAEEPSMEEILASIRQIISDDTDEGATEEARENYRHPTQHANDVATSKPDEASFDNSFEAALEAELGALKSEKASPVAVDLPSFEERTGELKRTINTLDPDQAQNPLDKYRERGRLKMEALAQQRYDAARAQAAQPKAQPVRRPAPGGQETASPVATRPATAAAARPALQRAPANPDPRRTVSPAPTAEAPAASKRAPLVPPAVVPARAATAPAPAPAVPNAARPRAPASSNELAQLILRERSGDVDRLLTEMMRPVVRKWLAENLSGVVERLVRDEIEHVSRGRTR